MKKKLLLGMSVIVLMGGVLLMGCAKNEGTGNNAETVREEETSAGETQEEGKYKLEDYIADIDNSLEDLAGKSYSLEGDDFKYSIGEIKLPYIKIESEDAKKVNDEIKKIYDDTIQKFKKELESKEPVSGFTAFYDPHIYKDILSILVNVTEEGLPDIPTYYAYNFDLTTGKLLSYEEVSEKIGMKIEDVHAKQKEAFGKYYKELEKDAYQEGETAEQYADDMYKTYENLLSEGTLTYCVDGMGTITNVIELKIPDGIAQVGPTFENFHIENK